MNGNTGTGDQGTAAEGMVHEGVADHSGTFSRNPAEDQINPANGDSKE